MVYDAFPFCNELDLLEIRMRYLWPLVDYFVIAESDRTFSGKAKPLNFADNQSRFDWAKEKVIHKVFRGEERPGGKTTATGTIGRNNVFGQRRMLADMVATARPGDIVLVGDVDEIPSKASLVEGVERMEELTRLTFPHTIRRLYVNTGPVNEDGKPRHSSGSFTCMVFRKNLAGLLDRPRRPRKYACVGSPGWHMSFQGGVEAIRYKLAACCHDDYNRPPTNDPNHLAKLLADPTGTSKMGLLDVPECIPDTGYEHLIFSAGGNCA